MTRDVKRTVTTKDTEYLRPALGLMTMISRAQLQVGVPRQRASTVGALVCQVRSKSSTCKTGYHLPRVHRFSTLIDVSLKDRTFTPTVLAKLLEALGKQTR